jgi:hypothetical protein
MTDQKYPFGGSAGMIPSRLTINNTSGLVGTGIGLQPLMEPNRSNNYLQQGYSKVQQPSNMSMRARNIDS